MKSNVSIGCAVLAIVLGVVGCAPETRPKPSTAEFQDIDSHLARDVAEVKKLCPMGTPALTAKDLLGGRCRLVHYYGPLLHADSQSPGYGAGEQDDWALEYEKPQGKICLWLKWPSGYDRSKLDYAVISEVAPKKKIFVAPPKEVPQ